MKGGGINLNDIDVYVFVRNYLQKFNQQKCIITNTSCYDCGICWMTNKEENDILELFKSLELRSI